MTSRAKKFSSLILLLCLGFLVIFTGCKSDDDQEAEQGDNFSVSFGQEDFRLKHAFMMNMGLQQGSYRVWEIFLADDQISLVEADGKKSLIGMGNILQISILSGSNNEAPDEGMYRLPNQGQANRSIFYVIWLEDNAFSGDERDHNRGWVSESGTFTLSYLPGGKIRISGSLRMNEVQGNSTDQNIVFDLEGAFQVTHESEWSN